MFRSLTRYLKIIRYPVGLDLILFPYPLYSVCCGVVLLVFDSRIYEFIIFLFVFLLLLSSVYWTGFVYSVFRHWVL